MFHFIHLTESGETDGAIKKMFLDKIKELYIAV